MGWFPRSSQAAAESPRGWLCSEPTQRSCVSWRSTLVEETGLTLGDYDVLSQLALAGGVSRMTDLANSAFSSRSGMTRRVDRLVDEGLVRRTGIDTDGRRVVVGLTKAGVARLSRRRRRTSGASPSSSWPG
ncbi:MAG: MarR family transcriptional regulator [Chloroflexi bacterium]|nr:MAG: MarR family transcriptional regulator [Chloroflexota bacterium]